MSNQTPLMKQYNQIKAKYPETILFYRLGDFFETFGDDAKITAKVCGITLTKRNNGAAGDLPLAGFPHHQLDVYLPRLVRSGYRVAVCEQLEDPKQAKGIVKRGVVEVVTPGVALYDKLLDGKSNNFASAIYIYEKNRQKTIGFAIADISTGEFYTSESAPANIESLLNSFKPQEILVSKSQREEILTYIGTIADSIAITKLEQWIFDLDFTAEVLQRHFKTHSLKGFGLADKDACIIASGALLNYINESQTGNTQHFTSIRYHNQSDYMILDYPTLKNLELAFSSDFKQEATLIKIIDKTITSGGARLMKQWVLNPLKNIDKINSRLDCTELLYSKNEILSGIQSIFKEFVDFERIAAKISTQRINPTELSELKYSIDLLPELRSMLINSKDERFLGFASELVDLSSSAELIGAILADEPSNTVGVGKTVRSGYNAELDMYINAKTKSKQWLNSFQEQEKNRSNIPSLKVGFNNVFGYYIEITKTHASKVPEDYERRQTLTNSERYTTPELKEMEAKILGAEEQISIIEKEIYADLISQLQQYVIKIQKNAQIISEIDCYQSFAELAHSNKYSKPIMTEDFELEIIAGRHPVVEKLLPKGEVFTANSTNFSNNEIIHILTGPNMSGKSCYLRQNALIVLLAQIGSYVPAESAKIGLVDRIYTRVGAQDNISGGESTFLVEMQEAANIINNATNRSLILLDEVGRGTATFDGISIAWAITEYLHNEIGAKTLFATHYHELNELANKYENVKNYQVEVVESGDSIVFTHKVKLGASNHSFGIYVAQMAGLPKVIIERSKDILSSLEGARGNDTQKQAEKIKAKKKSRDAFSGQLTIFEFKDDELREKIKNIDINIITPIEALKLLNELKNLASK